MGLALPVTDLLSKIKVVLIESAVGWEECRVRGGGVICAQECDGNGR